MIIAASTACFPHLSLIECFDRLVDLEYTSVEIAIHDDGKQITAAEVLADTEYAARICRDTHRLNLTGYSLDIHATGEAHLEQFAACCRLAKATKVATLTIPSSPLGTPFNEEVERLRKLVEIADVESVRVGIRSQREHFSEDPDTVVVLCDNVRGLGVSLDPSHYMNGPHARRGYDQLFKYAFNIYLRDSTKDKIQVRVGQGEIDYGKLITQLEKVHYNRALCVDIVPQDEVDHASEMRKLRMLLDSLL
ncbi:MAG: sugar phosphate isomerase/epimerase [Planctomycetota bacterium]|nr:sugar phosphate isomerase/epimerase [Planctomycetota bacterium]MDA1178583.1 sugar phosphate isomerase/epimerase [Planctomycetota bacterium]